MSSLPRDTLCDPGTPQERLFGAVQAPADIVPRARGPDGVQGPWCWGVPPPGAAGQGRGAELQGTAWPRLGRQEGTRAWPLVIQLPDNNKNNKIYKIKRGMVSMTATVTKVLTYR